MFSYKLIQQSINICTEFFICGWMRMAIMGCQKGLEKVSGKSEHFEKETEWQP